MNSEPPADFKGRKKWYAQQARATKHLYPHKKKKPKQKTHKSQKRCLPPVCFSFFPHTKAVRKYARKFRRLTKAEWEVWSRLVHDPFHKWHKQVPCGPYILDFYCHEARIAVEIDGPEHYTKEGLERDAKRTAFLDNFHNLRVLRYKNDDAYLDGDLLAGQIIQDNRSAVRDRIVPKGNP